MHTTPEAKHSCAKHHHTARRCWQIYSLECTSEMQSMIFAYRWTEVLSESNPLTIALQKLPPLELQLIAERFHLSELLSAPSFLRTAFLQHHCGASAHWNLETIHMRGDPDAWRACMSRLLTDAATMPFKFITMPSFLGHMRRHDRMADGILDAFSLFDARGAWSDAIPTVRLLNFHACSCSDPFSSERVSCAGTVVNGPGYPETVGCSCMPQPHSMRFVAHVLRISTALRGVTLPSFGGGLRRSTAGQLCSAADVKAVVAALCSLPNLKNLLVQQLPAQSDVPTLIRGISSCSSLASLRIEHTHEQPPESGKHWKQSASLQPIRMCDVARFRQLRDLSLPVLILIKPTQTSQNGIKFKSVDVGMGFRVLEGLERLQGLSHLRLDCSGDIDKVRVTLSTVARVLGALAQRLEELKSLKVLHCMFHRYAMILCYRTQVCLLHESGQECLGPYPLLSSGALALDQRFDCRAYRSASRIWRLLCAERLCVLYSQVHESHACSFGLGAHGLLLGYLKTGSYVFMSSFAVTRGAALRGARSGSCLLQPNS